MLSKFLGDYKIVVGCIIYNKFPQTKDSRMKIDVELF